VISVENFYSVLSTNLLEPVGLDCCYYFPFGSTKYFSRHQYTACRPKYDHHVLFHFDQEPLWTTDLGATYDSIPSFHSSKILKLLANSERSAIKKQVCQERNMIDWYFFYHGIAALDWFRDARYFGELQPINKIFCTMNHHTAGRRDYRMALIARLFASQLIEHGDISFHADRQGCDQVLHCPECNLSDISKHLVQKYVLRANLRPLPLILDHQNVNGAFSARFGYEEYKLWQNSFVHLVTETVFYDPKLHLTEKIFKPIVALRPFMLVAALGNLAYLKEYGFQTFDRWIDETYDTIVDHDQRLDAITTEVRRLCSLPRFKIHRMFHEMQDTLIYNKNHFFTTFRDRIVDELVDNFDTAIRVWNNGRIDLERTIPLIPNIAQIKGLLKQ
jgi:hypothetical protein